MTPLARALDSDLWHGFTRSPLTVAAALVLIAFFIGAAFAPWLAPFKPFDPASLNLADAFSPPLSRGLDGRPFLLGTDGQGRDVLSTIMYGSRISLLVGGAAVIFALIVGVALGLVSGYVGGRVDSVIMRAADVQLSFPTILIAILLDGVARVLLPRDLQEDLQIFVLVVAIGLSNWVQYARTVRAAAMSESKKDYVDAARVIGVRPLSIMLRHLLPNVMGPVLVIATIGFALAIITESTLSFLGLGVPPTQPSMGTLIRVGNEFLFSGEWWITIFPGVALVLLVLSVNLLGDWLRSVFNPKLRHLA